MAERSETVASDPLGVLVSTAGVMQQATSVAIHQAAIERLADELVASRATPPAWDSTLHFRAAEPDGAPRTAGWVLVLDALNFCFWAQGDDPDVRWRVSWRGATHDGYDALAAALSRAVDEGVPVWEPGWLAALDEDTLRHVLRPVPGSPEIPLFTDRLTNLRELGQGLLNLAAEQPGTDPVVSLIEGAEGSAVELVRSVVARFPSFDDTAVWIDPQTHQERQVRFYKRAQILVADLAGSLAGDSLGTFHDLGTLTAFADYKVPQVLRRFGILTYAPALADHIRRRELIAAGSREEIEIRAATIQACERIRQALANRQAASPREEAAPVFTASDIDWLLWNAGQSLPAGSEPYHRTRTIFY
ncbi:MAG: queuosine salvage family protein [Thermomicrobiales bacterium]